MSLLLQIETATTSCSVALAKDGVVLGFKQINQRNIHAEVITLFVEELLVLAGLKYDELDAIAVSSGPGSYTGLRIGISTAKGLCFALDKPLIAIETLESMTYGIINSGGALDNSVLLCPMIDARRMEVFTGVFTAEGVKIRPTAAEIIDADSFIDLLETNKMLFFGDGAEKCREVLGAHPNAGFLPDFVNSAAHLSQKALKKFRNKEFEDVAYFEPYYLKDFIAGKKAF
ncbi:tRNA (adenosine(37)-N6)-threonylcarbamoyltransferase complex dimerization subunit type 1 TsaB [Mucilaginibacter sp.]|uniref:tRNA (adenosine(37)-N6)-threonylcarbamoyltransferase complex dimerization subunit type 1 TsaB n=1 Tax=Mucilaginibacter sp. TaxID=1882438 RepID=UPI00284631A5|nr:tRNA (adenosine(37)-N6)-threonylcarbamoyltransferase complex dimerization subunit type 1 TsaB [Mucilaginibacter sp.]MDR3696021.1 tRNA (adenosine(37)-N6)-threonylcarbamoyltransferase complex dimerization subunit type 1 TsaB [Mucilaginibacter sp.]